jgi:putative phage-type endonuclease
MEQRSPEWFAARLGKVTASRIADVVARTKSGWGASRKNYLAELVCERLSGVKVEGFTNAAMQWGTDLEPDARAAYEFYRDVTVSEAGFAPHPTIADTGASPDGEIGADGLLELKCPNTATHIESLQGHNIPEKYVLQMQWQMACTGRQWCDFASFDPRLPEPMRLYVERVKRDDAQIAELENEVVLFLNEVRATERALRKKYGLQDDSAIERMAEEMMAVA